MRWCFILTALYFRLQKQNQQQELSSHLQRVLHVQRLSANLFQPCSPSRHYSQQIPHYKSNQQRQRPALIRASPTLAQRIVRPSSQPPKNQVLHQYLIRTNPWKSHYPSLRVWMESGLHSWKWLQKNLTRKDVRVFFTVPWQRLLNLHTQVHQRRWIQHRRANLTCYFPACIQRRKPLRHL